MIILVLNCGSSSVKYKLMDTAANAVLSEGGAEKIGLPDSFLKIKSPNGEKEVIDAPLANAKDAVSLILKSLARPDKGVISDYNEIQAVGNRVVHGMERFTGSVLITDEVLADIKKCYVVAPLHNPANVAGIEAVKELLPNVPQVAVFDTAFHQTMPPETFMYALPYDTYTNHGVRRYGFHGTSHRYVSRRACEFLGLPYEKQRIISCHIGNGASITAVKDGKSFDTSMGLTPVEGLVMGTRCGDVDPGALIYLMKAMNLSVDKLDKMINKQSGELGVSGVSSDMRDIEDAISAGNERAKLAMAMYNHRIIKYVGAYIAALNGVDVIVFTGGVGENQPSTREAVCRHLEFMGVTFDAEANKTRGKEIVISGKDSSVKVVVIPTDEELVIAQDTEEIVSKL